MKKRRVIVDGKYAYVTLTQQQVAIIDADVATEIAKYNWYAHWNSIAKSYYVSTSIKKSDGKRTTLGLHRFIYELYNDKIPDEMEIDHINHNTFDNRISNLKLVTVRENSQNLLSRKLGLTSSKFVGVYWNKPVEKWVARIRYSDKRYSLGCYTSELAAHKVYKIACEVINMPISPDKIITRLKNIKSRYSPYARKQKGELIWLWVKPVKSAK